MSHRLIVQGLLVALLLASVPSPSSAQQPIGIFRWQLQPFCNVVSLSVTQIQGVFTLDGTDDQCSTSAQPAAVSGIATLNPNGSIGFGLSVVTAPGAAPVHINATLTLPNLNGTWTDSAGSQGTLTFTPGTGTGGSPRPAGGIGGAAVNSAQVQLRITGSCPAGSAMVGVGQTGAVACQLMLGGGDITAALAGPGLLGGGSSGDVTLQAAFAGSGTTDLVARADHTHQRVVGNTAIGENALFAGATGQFNFAAGFFALGALTSGDENVAVGAAAMDALTSGTRNTAVGTASLSAITGAGFNTAVGWNALFASLGAANVAVGDSALRTHSVGAFNTAIGSFALTNLTSGGQNVALGQNAGTALTAGTANVYLANEGVAAEDNTIRLGSGVTHTRLFLAATRGVTTGVNDAIPVLIDGNGQLGTMSSSRRTKEGIADLGAVSLSVQRLHPVQFRYRTAFADGSKPIQYGLIAEEVEGVLPELVAYGQDGQPETVKYHVLPTLLLAEVQRLERERAAHVARLDAQERELAALRALIDELRRALTTAR